VFRLSKEYRHASVITLLYSTWLKIPTVYIGVLVPQSPTMQVLRPTTWFKQLDALCLYVISIRLFLTRLVTVVSAHRFYPHHSYPVIQAIKCFGVARILCWGGPESSRRRRRRVGNGMGRGTPLPSRLGGLGERRKLPSGVRAEPWPKTDFGAFWARKNESGDDKFDIVCHFYSAYLQSNLQG